MAKLYIIRGIPGSGKSTFARKMIERHVAHTYFEADMYFMDQDGNYNFDRTKLGAAHKWCYDMTTRALSQGKTVVVSNTFTTMRELQPYLDYCRRHHVDFEVLRMISQYKSIHDVPEDALVKMRQRFQDFPGEMRIKTS